MVFQFLILLGFVPKALLWRNSYFSISAFAMQKEQGFSLAKNQKSVKSVKFDDDKKTLSVRTPTRGGKKLSAWTLTAGVF